MSQLSAARVIARELMRFLDVNKLRWASCLSPMTLSTADDTKPTCSHHPNFHRLRAFRVTAHDFGNVFKVGTSTLTI